MRKISNLLRYSGWNFGSLIIPLLVGLVAIPYLLKQIGIERLGVLSIIWALIGYFNLFDFGISKALTKKISEGRVNNDVHTQREVFWTAMLLLLGTGFLGCISLYSIVYFFGSSFIKTTLSIRAEVNQAMLLVAVSVPLIVISSGLRGCLEAYEEFRMSNLIRLSLGLWMFLAPVFVTRFGYLSLEALTMTIIFGRIAAAIVSWNVVTKMMSGLGTPLFSRKLAEALFLFGAWITLSGVLGPLMSYADRFLIGSIVGAAGVSYYAIPQDVVSKLWLLPVAINTALFPLLVMELKEAEVRQDKLSQLTTKSIAYALIGVLPFSLVFVMFPFELLQFWLGEEFAAHSMVVLQMFSVGVAISSIGVVLVSILYASNRPDMLAKLYLVELPIFVVVTIYCTNYFGIVGAAFAWMARCIIDTLLLWNLTSRLYGKIGVDGLSILLLMVVSIGSAFLLSGLNYLLAKIALCAVLNVVVLSFCYKKLTKSTIIEGVKG